VKKREGVCSFEEGKLRKNLENPKASMGRKTFSGIDRKGEKKSKKLRAYPKRRKLPEKCEIERIKRCRVTTRCATGQV